jgi:hypothetical protein
MRVAIFRLMILKTLILLLVIEHKNSGAGTRTPDTRIMIPLL